MKTPPNVNEYTDFQTFTTNTYKNATLYIPEGTMQDYKAAKGWRHFVFIEEIPIGVGIHQVQSNDKDFAVSNIGNVLIVQGAIDGERVCAYTLDGKLIGSTFCRNGSASLSLETGKEGIVLVKVGQKVVKFSLK